MNHVFIIAALSADGFLADTKNQEKKSTTWTSQEDYAFFVSKTKEAGVCIMGSRTYQTIGHPLKDRRIIVYTNHPENIKIEPGVETTNLPPKDLIKSLSGYPAIAICGGSSIYTLFMKAGLVDTLYLTYEPVLFGTGVSLFNEPIDQKLSLVKTTALSPQTTLQEFSLSPLLPPLRPFTFA